MAHLYLFFISYTEIQQDVNTLLKEQAELQACVVSQKIKMDEHQDRANEERRCYQQQGLKAQDPANSTLLLSVDFKKGIVFPYFRRTVQQIYFLQRPLCNVFGVVDESTKPNQCTLYFYGNDVGGTSWTQVVSILEIWILAKMRPEGAGPFTFSPCHPSFTSSLLCRTENLPPLTRSINSVKQSEASDTPLR